VVGVAVAVVVVVGVGVGVVVVVGVVVGVVVVVAVGVMVGVAVAIGVGVAVGVADRVMIFRYFLLPAWLIVAIVLILFAMNDWGDEKAMHPDRPAKDFWRRIGLCAVWPIAMCVERWRVAMLSF
jgi:hypothetical protein